MEGAGRQCRPSRRVAASTARQPVGALPKLLSGHRPEQRPPSRRTHALRPLGRWPHGRQGRRRRALPSPAFHPTLPLGDSRSSILADPTPRRLPETPPESPVIGVRVRRECMQPGRARRARAPGDEDRIDLTAWRRAEARLWEQVEDRRWLGFWWLETRARKEWAELHKRQEDMRQRLDRESRTLRGRLRVWRIERSLRELIGAVRGREDLVEGWREALDRYHRRAGRAGQGTRRQRPSDRAEGVRGLPQGTTGGGAARTTDRHRAGGAADEGARPEHHPHSAPTQAPSSRA